MLTVARYGVPLSSALHGKKLFVTANKDDMVYVVDADEGSPDYGTKEEFVSVPTPRDVVVDVTSDRLYVSSADGYVYAFSLQNGQQLAKYWTRCPVSFGTWPPSQTLTSGLTGLAMRSTHPDELYASCACYQNCDGDGGIDGDLRRRVIKMSINGADDTSTATISNVYLMDTYNPVEIDIADNGLDIYISVQIGPSSSLIAKGNLGSPASRLEELYFDPGMDPQMAYAPQGLKVVGNLLIVSNLNDRVHALNLLRDPLDDPSDLEGRTLEEAFPSLLLPAYSFPVNVEVSTDTDTLYVICNALKRVYTTELPCPWLPSKTVIQCPETDITLTTEEGKCTAIGTWAEPTPSCGSTLTSTHQPGDAFDVGKTIVSYNATDGLTGASSSLCQFTVIVSRPVYVKCPEDQIISAPDEGKCSAIATWTEPTKSCGSTLTSFHEPGDAFDVGNTTVTYTAKDEWTEVTSSCSFTVRVLWDKATHECEPACAAAGGVCMDNCGSKKKSNKGKGESGKGRIRSNCDEDCTFFNAILSPGNSKCDAAGGGGRLCRPGLVCCKGCNEGDTRYPSGTLASFQSQLSETISKEPMAAMKALLPVAFASGASRDDLQNAMARLFSDPDNGEAAAALSKMVIPNQQKAAEFIKDAVISAANYDRQLDVNKIMSGLKATMQGTLEDASLAAQAANRAAVAASAKAAATEINVKNLGALRAEVNDVVAGLGELVEGAAAQATDAASQAKNRF